MASSTSDNRTHVMGDMLMITGTFTEGGKEISYDGLVSTVFAAGGHFTTTVFSGVTINNAATEAVGQTVLTCDTQSVAGAVTSCLNVGQTLYSEVGTRLGIITAVDATSVTIDTPLVAPLPDNAKLNVLGGTSMALKSDVAVTSHTVTLDVSIDETNSLVIFSTGNEKGTITATDAAVADATMGGRWWILGQR